MLNRLGMIIALSKCANFWSTVNLVSSKLWVCLHAGRSNMALVLICECGFLFCMKADIRDALGVVIIAWVLTISCWSPLKNKPTVKRQTHSLGKERQVCKPLMMMEYNLLHKGYNEGVTQQSIGNAFDMKALRYLGMNNSFFLIDAYSMRLFLKLVWLRTEEPVWIWVTSPMAWDPRLKTKRENRRQRSQLDTRIYLSLLSEYELNMMSCLMFLPPQLELFLPAPGRMNYVPLNCEPKTTLLSLGCSHQAFCHIYEKSNEQNARWIWKVKS